MIKLGDLLRKIREEVFRPDDYYGVVKGMTTDRSGWMLVCSFLASMASYGLLTQDEYKVYTLLLRSFSEDDEAPFIFEEIWTSFLLNIEVYQENELSSVEEIQSFLNHYEGNKMAMDYPETMFYGTIVDGYCFFAGGDMNKVYAGNPSAIYKIDMLQEAEGEKPKVIYVSEGDRVLGQSREGRYIYIHVNDEETCTYDLVRESVRTFSGRFVTYRDNVLFVEDKDKLCCVDGSSSMVILEMSEYEIATPAFDPFSVGVRIKPLIRGAFIPYNVDQYGRVSVDDDVSSQVWMDIILSSLCSIGLPLDDAHVEYENRMYDEYALNGECTPRNMLEWFEKNKKSDIYEATEDLREVIRVLGNQLGGDTDVSRLLLHMRQQSIQESKEYYDLMVRNMTPEVKKRLCEVQYEDLTSIRLIGDLVVDYDHCQYLGSSLMRRIISMDESELADYIENTWWTEKC